MQVYTRNPHGAQEPLPDVEILTEDQIAGPIADRPSRSPLPAKQVSEFWDRLPEDPSSSGVIRAITDEWITGCYDAAIAVRWLIVLRAAEPSRSVEAYHAMCDLARRVRGSVRLPERAQENGRAVA